MNFQGIGTSIAKKPYIFVILQGGGGGSGLPVSPLDPPMIQMKSVPRCTTACNFNFPHVLAVDHDNK